MDRRAFMAAAGAGSVLAAAPSFAARAATRGQPPRIATYVTGLSDHGGRTGVPAPGNRVRLLRVRDRAFDPLSVAVLAEDGRTLGYLPGVHGQVLAPLLDAGLGFEAIVADGASGRAPRLELELALAGTGDKT